MNRMSDRPIRLLAVAAVAVLALGLGPPAAVSGTAPDAQSRPAARGGALGDRFGVASSHIKLYPDSTARAEFASMRDAGIKWVRCDFAWSDLEPLQGAWDFAGADRAVAAAAEHGVSILGILGTSPPWANGGNEWNWPPTDTDAWKEYVNTVCSRYAGKVAAWEVWNEENIDAFWQPQPDLSAYLALLAAASPEIRAADPAATVVMGGVAGLDPDFLAGCLKAGAAEYVDAVAYHPYAETIGVAGQRPGDAYRPKEDLCRSIVAWVHLLAAQYTAKDLEVWITEVGWTTCATTPPGVDAATQAAYMLRTLINYASTDVDRVIWYNLRDEHLNAWDDYGLLRYDFDPKPSYRYYATFSRVFGPAAGGDAGAVSFTCSRPDTLEAHCFRLADGRRALAAWKRDDADDLLTLTVNDPAYGRLYQIDPLTGERTPLCGLTAGEGGKLSVGGLHIGKVPLIMSLEEGALPSATRFYFAEGYTGSGFQEYICLGNMDDVDARIRVTFLLSGGGSQERDIVVPRGSRTTLDVNAVVGAGQEVSAVVSCGQEIVAERPMYFTYGTGWTGGHDVVGARAPSAAHYFAEGYTGAGFDEWLCVLNPGDVRADLTFRFQVQEEGERVSSGWSVEPRSRVSFKVNDILGEGLQASCTVESSRPVVAERPMYFAYAGRGAHGWEGGHCVTGAPSLASEYLFAEGTTRPGFEEWLTIQNPHDHDITVAAEYQFGPGQGEPVRRTYGVPAHQRSTLFVPDEVGWGKDVSAALSSPEGFLAERPMYFDHTGMGAPGWRGGHCVIGAACAAAEWLFAEGYTGEGFQTWLCLQNPSGEDAEAEVAYLTQEAGALPPRGVSVPAGSRVTVFVNGHAGPGYQLSSRVRVVSGPGIVAERPMYFVFRGRDGGHDVVGYAP